MATLTNATGGSGYFVVQDTVGGPLTCRLINFGEVQVTSRNAAMNAVLPDPTTHAGQVMYSDGTTWKSVALASISPSFGTAASHAATDFDTTGAAAAVQSNLNALAAQAIYYAIALG